MCADYLEEHLAPGEFTSLGRVAGHLIGASLYEDAASRLLEAARLAVDCGEFSSADEYLVMRDGALDSLHTGPTNSLRIDGWLGRINRWCTQNQKLDEALLLVGQVVDASREQDLKREHGLGLFYQGVIADHEGDHVGAQSSYNEAFFLLEQEGSPEELALAYYVRARSLYYLGELSEALKLCTEATKRYRDVGDDFGAAR
jgi:tetratricopeptide (TPR) repeat protein